MKLRFFLALVLSIPLSFAAIAQQDNGGIKQDTKDAAHSTAQATKKAGRKIKHGTKKTVNKGAHETRKAAGKVENKTQPTPPQQ